MRIMKLLEVKSKQYKDIPQSCIFVMNNGRYIVHKIKEMVNLMVNKQVINSITQTISITSHTKV
ncbi:hypothetical protein AALP_AAs43067U000100 [Arabis alpina]|uniref:Exocyst complex subunit Exo70 C-terminal domain-containing protein n=1 Tax=Arabis alpina TaxID=50452 RepID=A0A087G1C7_ARAAL|nr:hypothetical protein AALP_AAs43067U000100 [Arabis alpina]